MQRAKSLLRGEGLRRDVRPAPRRGRCSRSASARSASVEPHDRGGDGLASTRGVRSFAPTRGCGQGPRRIVPIRGDREIGRERPGPVAGSLCFCRRQRKKAAETTHSCRLRLTFTSRSRRTVATRRFRSRGSRLIAGCSSLWRPPRRRAARPARHIPLPTEDVVACSTENVGQPGDHRACFHKDISAQVARCHGATAGVVADGRDLFSYSGALDSSP